MLIHVDVLGPDLKVLFVGINPSLRSAEVGHNFARPGNRFYPALHAAGFTPRLLRPDEDGTLPAYGVGITNIVARPTRAADELGREELRAGARELDALVARIRPRAGRRPRPRRLPDRVRAPEGHDGPPNGDDRRPPAGL